MMWASRRGVVTAGLLALVATACTGSIAPISSSHSPTPATDSPVIVLVHGFSPTAEGYSCAEY